MKRTTTILLIAGLAVAASACTESRRARNAATWSDQPADITCWTYGTETFSGRSTGKVEYNDGGRIAFDLERIMRTDYRIDDFQQVYFVIPSIEALNDATLEDFGPIYDRLKGASEIGIEAIQPYDRVITRGSQAYAAKGGRFAA